MRNDHPCTQDCPRRTGTCRAKCPDLAAYEEKRKAIREALKDERKRRNLVDDYVSDTINAGRRRHR